MAAQHPGVATEDGLPSNLVDLPTVVPSPEVLADAELLLTGALAPLAGFLEVADVAAVRSTGRLADGTPWPAEVVLPVPAALAARAVAAGGLVLSDTESVPRALLELRPDGGGGAGSDIGPDDGTVLLGGPLRALAAPSAGPYAALRRPPAEVRTALPAGPVLAAVLDRPVLAGRLSALRAAAADLGDAHLLLLVRVADEGPDGLPPEALVACTLQARGELGPATVATVALAHRGDPDRDARLAAHVAAAYGATHLLADRDPGGVPLTVVPRAAADPDPAALRVLLDRAEPLPGHVAPPAVAGELRRWRPPLAERGFTVLFTGFSGSGKSTVARQVANRLVEATDRRVSLLDGDEVRHLLSAGLGFSREDRDLNIRRIGFVAAEITRHGGVALCAPIAPYAAARAAVRRMVEAGGGFVLVHVATPLEVCEQRDRKGLYAKARAGVVPSFTGVSDPYEAPTDADLVLDTSTMSVEEASRRVVDVLAAQGYIGVSGDPGL